MYLKLSIGTHTMLNLQIQVFIKIREYTMYHDKIFSVSIIYLKSNRFFKLLKYYENIVI